jgi:peptidoglycan/xylan/chitin deacetylase (PgdA/CDA1 family)
MRLEISTLLCFISLVQSQEVPPAPSLDPSLTAPILRPGTWALTFDNGPTSNIPALLDELRNLNVPATFFVNAQNFADLTTRRDQQLLLDIYNGGYTILT